MPLSRRDALKSGVMGSLATGLGACTTTPPAPDTGATFDHGVASGEPAETGFLIWTRISFDNLPRGAIDIEYDIAENSGFERIIYSGSTRTSRQRDFTVKAILSNLKSGQTYYYRFRYGAAISPTGRSRTLPVGSVDNARFAIVSCSNYAFGHFNVYDAIAKRDNVDAVIHLGDYIYEYGTDGYGGPVSKQIGREHVPDKEIISLDDYRARHAQYKSDSGSLAMHAAHPLIPIWDDHETTNNSWENGAENHDLSEGDWDERRQAALRAYYEWMPVRDPARGDSPEALLREFQWGDLLTLATLETRLMARSEQLDYAVIGASLATPDGLEQFKTVDLVDDRRELLGQAQSERLHQTMAQSVQSGTRWRVIANQIIMAEVIAPNLSSLSQSPAIAELEKVVPQIRDFIALTTLDIPLNTDAWDGYPAARERFYKAMSKAGARDLIVLTGDTHEWWANELRDQSGQRMGVELGTAAVTSPGSSSYFGEEAETYSRLLNERNSMVQHHNPFGKGYIDLAFSQDGAQADFIEVSNVLTPDYEVERGTGFALERDNGSLRLNQN